MDKTGRNRGTCSFLFKNYNFISGNIIELKERFNR